MDGVKVPVDDFPFLLVLKEGLLIFLISLPRCKEKGEKEVEV